MAECIRHLIIDFRNTRAEEDTAQLIPQVFLKMPDVHNLELCSISFEAYAIVRMLMVLSPLYLSVRTLKISSPRFLNPNDIANFLHPYRNFSTLVFWDAGKEERVSSLDKMPESSFENRGIDHSIQLRDIQFLLCGLPFAALIMSLLRDPPFERCPLDLTFAYLMNDHDWDTIMEELFQHSGDSLKSLRLPCTRYGGPCIRTSFYGRLCVMSL